MGQRTMRRSLFLVCWLAVPLGAIAQTSKPPKSVGERLTDAETRLEGLDAILTAVSRDTGDRSTTIDCKTGNFVFLMPTTGTLTFLVSCTKIEPFLEGFRLTLDIGNPYSMRFEGLSGALHYGENYLASTKQTTTFTSTESLTPGIWNPVIVTIGRAEAKDVRLVRVDSLTFRTAAGK